MLTFCHAHASLLASYASPCTARRDQTQFNPEQLAW